MLLLGCVLMQFILDEFRGPRRHVLFVSRIIARIKNIYQVRPSSKNRRFGQREALIPRLRGENGVGPNALTNRKSAAGGYESCSKVPIPRQSIHIMWEI